MAGALVAAAAMFMAAASNTYTITGKAAAAAGYPSDPTIGGRLLVAQELAAERETAGLERAIGLLEGVTAQAPGFAPGHAGLAEALILSREFGARADADAFRQARAAAMAAVRIDPDLPSGHRLLGFISYWKDGDFAQAQKRFERALALDPNDVLSHFWYGNILSDRGDHGSALAELERARTLDPGSLAIRTDLAWAQWAAGQDAVAIPALQEIARSNPGFPVAQDCLAIIALVNGDDKGYVVHFTRFALARQDKRLMRKAQHLAEAGPARLRRLVYEQALSDVAEGSRGRAWPVLVASLRGDRRAVMQLLQAAEREHEVWGDAALVPRIRAVWKNDRRIAAMIDLRVGGISLASR
ncbi:tetratricopeptide repeat protein [Novosphingobium guangzhouense]|nr:tetratricopeptide repeat protein [Novosphingobium guangzhouense]